MEDQQAARATELAGCAAGATRAGHEGAGVAHLVQPDDAMVLGVGDVQVAAVAGREAGWLPGGRAGHDDRLAIGCAGEARQGQTAVFPRLKADAPDVFVQSQPSRRTA